MLFCVYSMWYPVFDKKNFMKLLVEPNFFTVLLVVWPSKLYGLNAPAFAYSVCLWLNNWTIEYVDFSSKRSFACFYVSVWVVCHLRASVCVTMVVVSIDMLCWFDWCAYLSVCMNVCDHAWKHTLKSYTRTHAHILSIPIDICLYWGIARADM